jgi:hypothetical protein
LALQHLFLLLPILRLRLLLLLLLYLMRFVLKISFERVLSQHLTLILFEHLI